MQPTSEFIRTTIYLHKRQHESIKMMAVYAHTSMSNLMRVAIKEKIEKMKNEFEEKMKHDKH